MKIGIANDHHGIELKKKIIDYLEKKYNDKFYFAKIPYDVNLLC